MRALPFLAVALALSACGKNDQKDVGQNVDESLTTENIVSNDVTAIDAVTGDAANMAADVDMNFGDLDQNVDIEASLNEAGPRPRSAPPKKSSPAAPSEPASNAATNAE